MRHRNYPVLVDLAGVRFTCDLCRARDEQERLAWLQDLVRAYAAGAELSCQCPGQGTRRLRLDASSGLRREAGSGPEHAPSCNFHFPLPAQSGLVNYAWSRLEEGENGNWRMDIGQSPDGPLEGFVQTGSVASHSVFALRGLLHFLWMVSGLNGWAPACQPWRTVRDVHDQVVWAARSIYLGRHSLADCLLVGTPGVKAQKQANRAKALAALEVRKPFLALVPLAAWTIEREKAAGGMLPLTDFDGIPSFSCTCALWERALAEEAFTLDAWRAGDRVLAMVLATPESARFARVEKLVLMPVSSGWLPVYSEKERCLERCLREEERCFRKPLSFDDKVSQSLPNFWVDADRGHKIWPPKSV